MADEDEQQLTDAIVGGGDDHAGGGGVMLWIVLGAVMALGAGGGFVVSRFIGAGSSTASAGEAAPPASQPPDRAPVQEGELAYLPVPSVIANLNEERLSRNLKVTISLAVDARDEGEVRKLIEKRMVEVTDWLNIYLAGCTLEDVRGPKNLRRIQREIAENLNNRFWPEQKPRIEKVLLKEWHVQ